MRPSSRSATANVDFSSLCPIFQQLMPNRHFAPRSTSILVLRAIARGGTPAVRTPVSGEFASGGDRCLKQPTAMLLPSVLIKRIRSRGFCTGTLRWRGTVERAVHARGVVIVPKCLQLPRQIDCVPEEHAIEIFSANGADQPFDERMRTRRSPGCAPTWDCCRRRYLNLACRRRRSARPNQALAPVPDRHRRRSRRRAAARTRAAARPR
jgi:hypothetical protein